MWVSFNTIYSRDHRFIWPPCILIGKKKRGGELSWQKSVLMIYFGFDHCNFMNFLKRQLIEENTTVGQVNYKIWLSASIDSFIRWSGWFKSAKIFVNWEHLSYFASDHKRNFEALLFLRIAGKTSPGVQNLHKFHHFWLAMFLPNQKPRKKVTYLS